MPHGLIIKTELPGTMTYEDGMEVCLKENRRLCSSGEVCAGGSVPLGGVLDGDKWAPVSNSYNEWVQIGKDNVSNALFQFHMNKVVVQLGFWVSRG